MLLVALQAFIDKFRFNAKRASLVQSRIKAIERLGQSELIEEDPEYIFKFPAAEPVSPPILGFMDVDFGYPGGPTLFRNLNFGIDMESRFAMVGPNGEFAKAMCPSVFQNLHIHAVYPCILLRQYLEYCHEHHVHINSAAGTVSSALCSVLQSTVLLCSLLYTVCCSSRLRFIWSLNLYKSWHDQ